MGGLAGEGAGGDEDQGVGGFYGRRGREDEVVKPGREKGGGRRFGADAGGVVAFEGAAEADVCRQVASGELERGYAQLEVEVAE